MNTIKQHIAIVFIGIFVFPIVAQFVHFGSHHLEVLTRNESKRVQYSSDYDVFISQFEKHCPILEYKFSINDLADIFVHTFKILTFEILKYQTLVAQTESQIVFLQSPRAPPYFL